MVDIAKSGIARSLDSFFLMVSGNYFHLVVLWMTLGDS